MKGDRSMKLFDCDCGVRFGVEYDRADEVEICPVCCSAQIHPIEGFTTAHRTVVGHWDRADTSKTVVTGVS